MRAAAAVIDSSPLIGLTHLDLALNLSLFFHPVYVPRSVQREVNRRSRFRYRLRKLYQTGLFVPCRAADRINVDLLRQDLGEGEAEALVQAQEKQARFFIGDDQRARQLSGNMGLVPVGTARLLARLHLEGYAEETGVLVRKLRRDLRFRIADSVLDEAVARAGEPLLPY